MSTPNKKMTQSSFLSLALCVFRLLFAYTGDFEELGSSAKAMAKGSAVVAQVVDAATIYYNPANTCLFNNREATFLHSENFGGIFRNDYLGFILPFQNYAMGIGLYALYCPGVKITKLVNETLPPSPSNPPIVEKIVTTYDGIIYINQSLRLLQEKDFSLALGLNGKIIYRSLGIEDAFGFGGDLGIGLSLPHLTLGWRLRNLFASPLFWSDTTEYLRMRGALGMSKTFSIGKGDIVLSYEIEGNTEKLPFYSSFGLEYNWQFLALRVGLLRRCPTFGFGLVYKNFYVDYAYESSHYPEPESRELPPTPFKISGGVRF